MSSTISFKAVFCPSVRRNGSMRAGRLPNAIVDRDRPRLGFADRRAFPQRQAKLKQEELLEDEADLRRCPKLIELIRPRVCRRKMRLQQRCPPIWKIQTLPHTFWKRIGEVRRQARQHVVYEAALHLRRHRPGLLVDRDDAAGVDRQRLLRFGGVRVAGIDDLVVRVHQLQARPRFDGAEQNDVDVAAKDVL